MTYNTHAVQPIGDYGACRSVADIEAVLQPLQPRPPLSWTEGMHVVKHPAQEILARYPQLAALAEAKRRLPEVLAALEQLEIES